MTSKAEGMVLKKVIEQLNSPVSEEHAWAVAYLTATQVAADSHSSPDTLAQISVDNILVTKKGNVELLKESRKGDTIQDDLKTVLQNLGMVVYQLLDYGLPEDQERALSPPLESLIETLVELDPQSDTLYDDSEVMDSPTSLGTQDSGITMGTTGADTELLAKVIEACEHHVMEVADPMEHYRQISSGLVKKSLQILELQSTQTQTTAITTPDTLVGETWSRVMESVRSGVHLQPVPKSSLETNGPKLYKFDDFLMTISKFDKNRLNKVEFDYYGNPVSDHTHQLPPDILETSLHSLCPSFSYRSGRRATVGDTHGALMSELLSHPSLKPVSDRKLRSLSATDCPLSPMQSLLAEIKSPPSLRKIKRTSPKRLSMSLESYRMCKSNPDLLDIPLTPPPLAYHSGRWANAWNRRLSASVTSLSSPHFSHSPQPAHTLTHPPPTHHSPSKPKKRNSFFHKLTQKISHKDSTNRSIETVMRSSCPNLLDEEVPMAIVPPYNSPEVYNSVVRGARSSVPTFLPPLCSLGEDDVFTTDPPMTPTLSPQQFDQHSHLLVSRFGEYRRERPNSWTHCDNIVRGGRTFVEVEKKEKRTLLDALETNVHDYSRPYAPHTPLQRPSPLCGHSPRPHSRTPRPHTTPPRTDEPLTTLSEISLQLSLYEDPATLSELIHVRTNVTKAQLQNMQLQDRKMFKNLQEEKVCFSCRKTKFSVFHRSHLCKICNRRVCSKCGKKHCMKGPPTPPQVLTLFWDPFSIVKTVYLCTPCLLYICPEEKNKNHHEECYDC